MKLDLDDESLHRYLRVYRYYKSLIENGKLEPDTKLPSIRKCSLQLRISKTTVETAYMMLAAEGYIISRPQSGFYVAKALPAGRDTLYKTHENQKKEARIQYDFASSNVARDSFQFELWRRYVKSALRQDERLLSYGEPQGERELREALCDYLGRHRNVVCTPEHIIVGAGVQSLLHILCPMVREREKVLFYNTEFRQGRTVFEDHGFLIPEKERTLRKENTCQDGPADLPENSLFYLTPSQMTIWGEVMHISERMELIKTAYEKNILVIEDDYNCEFKYYNRPTPSLQGLSGGRNVVYLGTFSRLLLPSIRLSFMVLPPELLNVYRERGVFYNQTASKAEQIALCQFIRDGHLESQIRKIRKLYSAKAKRLCEEIGQVFGQMASAHMGEAGFLVMAELMTSLSPEEISRRAKKAGIAIRPLPNDSAVLNSSFPRILLSCSTVPAEQYREALLTLKQAVFSPE